MSAESHGSVASCLFTSNFPFTRARTLTRDAGAEFVGELGQQVVINSVFGRTQDDDGTRVVHCRKGDRKFKSGRSAACDRAWSLGIAWLQVTRTPRDRSGPVAPWPRCLACRRSFLCVCGGAGPVRTVNGTKIKLTFDLSDELVAVDEGFSACGDTRHHQSQKVKSRFTGCVSAVSPLLFRRDHSFLSTLKHTSASAVRHRPDRRRVCVCCENLCLDGMYPSSSSSPCWVTRLACHHSSSALSIT